MSFRSEVTLGVRQSLDRPDIRQTIRLLAEVESKDWESAVLDDLARKLAEGVVRRMPERTASPSSPSSPEQSC
jgi:hypothetical protein